MGMTTCSLTVDGTYGSAPAEGIGCLNCSRSRPGIQWSMYRCARVVTCRRMRMLEKEASDLYCAGAYHIKV